jgi:hypothetical protein
MKSNYDKELKSVISLLCEMANMGTLEQGQKEAVTNEINGLRRATRSHDPAKIRAAVGRVARLFLRAHGR